MYALFKLAAEQGHADAQVIYASALKRGRVGGKKDFAAAEAWYRKAAEQGHPEAFVGVASCLWEAIRWARGIGLEVFDFEGSSVPGVERFFRRFGGNLETVTRSPRAEASCVEAAAAAALASITE